MSVWTALERPTQSLLAGLSEVSATLSVGWGGGARCEGAQLPPTCRCLGAGRRLKYSGQKTYLCTIIQ